MSESSSKHVRKALVLVDFINEIVSEGGKLAGKGYFNFLASNGVASKVSGVLQLARGRGWPVIHVRVGFSTSYHEHPSQSPLFGGAKKFSALCIGTWGGDFADFAMPLTDEPVIVKHRVSAFYGTSLELLLRSIGVNQVLIAGCASDLAVQSAVRDAHDRDFGVCVIEDACVAASLEDHTSSMKVLAKIAEIVTVDSL